MKSECELLLKKLTGKKFIVFTQRGNAAIMAALSLVKHLGMKKILIQDMGGWITYPQFIDKLKLEQIKIKTDYGLVENIPEGDVLLINSMVGYSALQDMSAVFEKTNRKNIFLINDVSGSIGTDEAKFGDFIIGSFGRWKPLNVEDGGFIATNNEDHITFLDRFSKNINFEKLHKKLLKLDEKLIFFDSLNKKIKKDLSDFDIVHKDIQGINVIVRFSSDSGRERLIKYCKQNNLEFVECPKYIRVLDDAISIEVKRLEAV